MKFETFAFGKFEMVAFGVVVLVGVLVVSGVLFAPPKGSSRVDVLYRNRLEASCSKCGEAKVGPRYCKDRCQTPSPTLDPLKHGAPVVWGHEHIHRACGSCGYSGEAIECLDKEQP